MYVIQTSSQGHWRGTELSVDILLKCESCPLINTGTDSHFVHYLSIITQVSVVTYYAEYVLLYLKERITK